jgi:hypothetical protein
MSELNTFTAAQLRLLSYKELIALIWAEDAHTFELVCDEILRRKGTH